MNHTVRDRKRRLTGVLAAVLFTALTVSVPEVVTLAAGKEITSSTMMQVLSKVNVRREPNTSAEVLGQLESGEKIFAVELTQEGWYQVAYNGETGYVRMDFLEVYTGGEDWNESLGEDVLPQSQPDIFVGQKGQSEAPEGSSAGQDPQHENEGESASGQRKESDASENSVVDQGTQSEAPENGSAAQDTDKEHKSGIPNVLILVLTGVVILAYAAFQILKERREGAAEKEQG